MPDKWCRLCGTELASYSVCSQCGKTV